MAESYIKFKVSNDVVSRTYEALQISKQTGKVKKGINEVTKSAERGIASLVVIAEDITPPEVAMHIPQLCEQKNIPYSYVPNKLELGKSIGLNVPCSAVAIENAGNAKEIVSEIVSKTTGKAAKKERADEKTEAKPEKRAEKRHEEKADKEEAEA
jgi:large subunit ribosomal protein L7Ae